MRDLPGMWEEAGPIWWLGQYANRCSDRGPTRLIERGVPEHRVDAVLVHPNVTADLQESSRERLVMRPDVVDYHLAAAYQATRCALDAWWGNHPQAQTMVKPNGPTRQSHGRNRRKVK